MNTDAYQSVVNRRNYQKRKGGQPFTGIIYHADRIDPYYAVWFRDAVWGFTQHEEDAEALLASAQAHYARSRPAQPLTGLAGVTGATFTPPTSVPGATGCR